MPANPGQIRDKSNDQKAVANAHNSGSGISMPAVSVTQQNKDNVIQNREGKTIQLVKGKNEWSPTHLVPGKLNVAGENHTEWSGEWRQAEQEFALEIVGGPRWEEQEFIGVKSHDERKEEVHGDGMLEMLRYTADQLNTSAELFFKMYNLKSAQVEKVELVKTKLSHFKNMARGFSVINSMPLTPKEIRIKAQLEPIFEKSIELSNKLTEFEQMARSEGQIDLDGMKAQIEVLVHQLSSVTYQLSNWYGPLSKSEGKDVEIDEKKPLGERERRSLHMHLVADGTSGKAGIWKIGDLHVYDINSFPFAQNRTYNLITKEIYDQEIMSWNQARINTSEEEGAEGEE